MSIQEHLNKIRNAIYGREVRESIAKGIETAYDDASEKDNANMEVKIARGTHPNLRSRLEEVDNKQQQTTTQLEEEYAPKLTEVTAQLAQKALQNDLINGLQSKITRNENETIGMEMLKTDIKSALTGGVWEVNLNTSDIVNEAITSAKRTVIGENGYVFGNQPAIVDYIEKKITYSIDENNPNFIYYRGKKHEIPHNTILPIPLSSTLIKYYFDTKTLTFHSAPAEVDGYMGEEDLLLGLGNQLSSGVLRLDMFGNYEYIGTTDRAFESGYIADRNNGVSVNFNTSEIVISQPTNIFYRGRRQGVISGSVFSFKDFENAPIIKVLFDVISKTFKFATHDAFSPTSHVFLGVIYPNERWYSLHISEQKEKTEVPLEYNLENTINSWWTYPLAKNYHALRDKTYISFTDNNGYSGVASLDNENGQIVKKKLKKAEVDDHNAPAIEVMDDGRLLAAYPTGHNTDGNMRVRISKNPESLEDFDDEIVIQSINGKTSYAQLFNVNGKWFLFYRSNARFWEFTTSSDGVNWNTPKVLIEATEQYYLLVRKTSDTNKLRLIMTSHPDLSDAHFRQAFLDPVSENLETLDGTVIGASAQPAQIPIIVPKTTDKKQRLLDVAVSNKNDTHILYVIFPTENSGSYYYANYNDSVLSTQFLRWSGTTFMGGSYFNGMVFKDVDTIIMSVGTAGIDQLQLWTKVADTFTLSETLMDSKSGQVAVRPFTADNTLFWQEGYYDTISYTDFYTDLKYLIIE